MKLDLGCGKNKKEGFIGIDSIAFEGVDQVLDLIQFTDKKKEANKNFIYVRSYQPGIYKPWIWEDNSIDEIHCSHMIEHLTWPERIHFLNEIYRILKKGSKAQIILPHWCSCRYYGDPTHQSPMSEFAFYYLLDSWRDINAPHTDYVCDFDATWGYSLNPILNARNPEYQQYAVGNFKEAVQDIAATLIKR